MELFTVAIPTLNRAETLAHTLESCMAQDDDRFEILVSNNRSDDATQDVIDDARQRDRRVRAIGPDLRLGMSDHFEFLLDQVQDGWVMTLGSDDALLPGCMPRLRGYREAYPGVDAIHQGLSAFYYYPTLGMTQAGSVFFDPPRPELELWPTSSQLTAAAQGDAPPWSLPYPYNLCWVRTSVLDDIVRRSGRRIHSAFPDIFMAVAIAGSIESYLHVEAPFALLGISPRSTGLCVVGPDGTDEADSGILRDPSFPLHPKIIHPRSVNLILVECLLQAIDAGLVRADLPIDARKHLARAFALAELGNWTAEQAAAHRSELSRQAALLGTDDVVREAAARGDLRSWIDSLGFPLTTEVALTQQLDGPVLGVNNVDEAAALLELVTRAALDSPELAAHESIAHAVLTWRRRSEGSREINYHWGDSIAFCADDGSPSPSSVPMLGFGPPTADGAWTIAPTAYVHIDTYASNRDAVLKVDASAFLAPPLLMEQSVSVGVDDQVVGTWTLTAQAPDAQPLIIPSSALGASGSFTLSFTFADARSPASVGLNADQRLIGLRFRSLTLTLAPN